MTTAEAIEREVRISARPETVFDLWIDPAQVVTWMGREATIDARRGGPLRLDYGGTDVVRGEIVEVDRPRRLVFTWGWEAAGDLTPPGASLVEVTIEPDGEGSILWLRHSGLVPEAIPGHAEGWDDFLGRLVERVTAPWPPRVLVMSTVRVRSRPSPIEPLRWPIPCAPDERAVRAAWHKPTGTWRSRSPAGPWRRTHARAIHDEHTAADKPGHRRSQRHCHPPRAHETG